jgi:hypothetical protein
MMLLACLAGPVIVGALGVAVLVGVGGAGSAIALCAAVPVATLAWRRRSARRAEPPASPRTPRRDVALGDHGSRRDAAA